MLASLAGAAVVVAVVAAAVALSSGRGDVDAAGQMPASTVPASTEPPAATTEFQPAPTTEAATPSSERVERDASEAVETVPTTSTAPATTQPEDTGSEEETVTEEEEASVEDPEEGNNGETSEPEDTGSEEETVTEEEEASVEDPEEGNNGETSEPEDTGSEEETVTEEEEASVEDPETEDDSTEWVLEISANPAWMAEYAEIDAFSEACGFYSGYAECDNPEDTQIMEQMISDFMGSECDFEINVGCRGKSFSERIGLYASRACPKGWSLLDRMICHHPDNLNYAGEYAYHDPSEADPRGVRSDHWD